MKYIHSSKIKQTGENIYSIHNRLMSRQYKGCSEINNTIEKWAEIQQTNQRREIMNG